MIPDCYDPVRQEETRQAAWDRFVEDLPRCGCCGEKIGPLEYYFEEANLILCVKCMNRIADNVVSEEEKRARIPHRHCGCCGDSIYGADYHYELRNLLLCKSCIDRISKNEFTMEVP